MRVLISRSIARRVYVAALVVLSALLVPGCGRTLAIRFQSHIDYLTGDQLAGRGVGTDGIRQAADYIAERFSTIGLASVRRSLTPFAVSDGSTS